MGWHTFLYALLGSPEDMTMFGICDCCKQANPLRFKNGQYLCDWCVAEYEELESEPDEDEDEQEPEAERRERLQREWEDNERERGAL